MKHLRKLISGILLLGLLCVGIQAHGDDILGDKTPAGNGWSESVWFGWVYDPYTPFYMHAQHGWVYAQKWGDWVWLWDYGVKEWFATSQGTYPMVYDFLEDSWFWYYTGTAQPRWYVDVEADQLFSEFHGTLMPSGMIDMLDMTLEVVEEDPEGGDEEPDLMSEAMGYVLLALMGDPATMVCPSITRTPEEVNIFALPPTLDANLDFGTGCTPEDSESVLSGSLSVSANNISFTEAGIVADMVITANDLTRDGMLLLDGDIIASVNVGMGETETTFDVEVTLDEVVSMESAISGRLQVSGSTTSTEDEFGDSEMTGATVEMTATDIVVDGGESNSGTLSLFFDEATKMTLDITLQTELGEGNLSLIATPTENEGMLFNTVGLATLGSYWLEVLDVELDETVCESMPIGGVIYLRVGKVEYRVEFTGNCEDGIRISKNRARIKA